MVGQNPYRPTARYDSTASNLPGARCAVTRLAGCLRAVHPLPLRHGCTVGDYLEGRAPRSGNEPPETGFTIIEGQPNTARAWTWEVRVPHDLIAGRLALRAIYMTEVGRGDYVDWLWRSSLADSESLRIHRWISDHVIVPKQDESVVRAATESMALEAAHG